jgi:hypothetical protein
LLAGVKPAVAGYLSKENAFVEAQKLHRFKLSYELSDYSFEFPGDSGPPKRVTRGSYRKIYIARDTYTAKRLKLADLRDNVSKVGQLLGYPGCCIKCFLHPKYKYPSLDTIFATRVFHWQLNFLAEYKLISHFPCSYECTQSLKMANQLFERLPDIRQRIKKDCSAPMLYFYPKNRSTDGADGTYARFEGTSRGDTIMFSRIIECNSQWLKELLQDGTRVRVTDKQITVYTDNSTKTKIKTEPEHGLIMPFDPK